MDISSENWLSELVMDDEEYNIFHQCQIDNSLDDFTPQDMATAMGGGENNLIIKQSFSSSESYSTLSNETTNNHTISSSFERPAKQLKTNNNSWNSSGIYTDDQVIIDPRSSSSSSSQVLSFANSGGSPPTNDSPQFSGNFDSPMKPDQEGTVYNGKLNYQGLIISKDCSSSAAAAAAYENKKNAPKATSQGNKRVHATSNRTPSHAQDHIMAERRRREKLSQRFIALSAIVPGLKKMDKASVLGDAIKYLKQLQERVNLLEEQTKKRTVESVVFVNKSQLTASSDEDTSSSDENPDVLSNESLPEIEARVSEKNVLIRIHCEKNKGVIAKVLSEVELLQLTVVNSTALPFGNHAMDITVVAQMENEFCMTVKDLVKTLRLAFLKFM